MFLDPVLGPCSWSLFLVPVPSLVLPGSFPGSFPGSSLWFFLVLSLVLPYGSSWFFLFLPCTNTAITCTHYRHLHPLPITHRPRVPSTHPPCGPSSLSGATPRRQRTKGVCQASSGKYQSTIMVKHGTKRCF